MTHVQNTIQLKNGVEMPVIGYGTWKLLGEDGYKAILKALELGYRHIDTAFLYENESLVGQAIQDSNVHREEIFITSKVWNTERGYDRTRQAFFNTLERMKLDYLDLYLIHWPDIEKHNEDWEETNRESWKALIDLYKEGKVRAIGVANFEPKHMKALKDMEEIPMVNQIEFHPGHIQNDVKKEAKELGIVLEGYSPNAQGELLENETVVEIAQKHEKTTAQVCIRFALEHDVVPLPKSVTPERIKENMDVFDFELDEHDMNRLNNMKFKVGRDPDNRDF